MSRDRYNEIAERIAVFAENPIHATDATLDILWLLSEVARLQAEKRDERARGAAEREQLIAALHSLCDLEWSPGKTNAVTQSKLDLARALLAEIEQ